MNLKQKIIKELARKDFPDFEFLYSDKVLDSAYNILNNLLEEEKRQFEDDLKIKNEDIYFEIFNRESILDIFWSFLNHLNNVNSSNKIRKIIEEFEPKLTDFSNQVSYSKRYFEMLEYCFKNNKLDIEQNKIIADEIRDYKIRGITLEKEKQEELKKINLELIKLGTKFSNNVLDDEKNFEYTLQTDKYLKEFPKSDLDNARILAEKKGKSGYAFDASHSSYIAIMKYCSSSEIRKYFAETHSNFASKGKFDNRNNVLEIIKLKNRKAKILGFENYAELSLEYKMADNPKQVLDLLENLSQQAKPKALREIEEIKNFFGLAKLNSWDMPYYSRILKEKKYKLDEDKLKQYFEFENTKNALFDTVKKLYGIEMKIINPLTPLSGGTDCSTFHNKGNGEILDDIEIYEVYKDNKLISYFVGDYFYNENKRSGAWNSTLREKYKNKIPIIANTMSFVKNNNGELLLTLNEVETLFHEFGHAIHGMLSRSKYSELSGYGVEWDFIELPSQLLEKWVNDELAIKNIAKHYKTGKSLDNKLFESYKKLKYFGTGNFIISQGIYGIIDMMFFSGIEFKDIDELQIKFLKKVNQYSIFKKDNNYKMYCSFSHIFDGAYSAGYYSYMWADIIVEEVWAVFKKNGIFDEKTANDFEQKILGAGSIKKASDMFNDFIGREISIDAFLKSKGLK